ncbi:MAG: hypothetical protein SNJ51_21420, partial [Roseiflexus sp.]
MIRRLLIMRLRRHTRLARALAGRAPLASRTAAEPLLLWVGGYRAMPPRRARAPVFLEAALRTSPQAGVIPSPPDSVQLPVIAAEEGDQLPMPTMDVFAESIEATDNPPTFSSITGPLVPDTLPTPSSAMSVAAGSAELREPAVPRGARDDLRTISGDESSGVHVPLLAEDERLVEERVVAAADAAPAAGVQRAAGAGPDEQAVAAADAAPAAGVQRAAGAGPDEQAVAAADAAPAAGVQRAAGA